MKKILFFVVLFPIFCVGGSYPVPLPSTSNNVMISTGKKWISGGPLTTKGDLFTYSTANTRIGVGTHGQVLTSDTGSSTGLSWATNSPSLPLTTKGDILVYSTSNDKQSVGANGLFLSSDTTQSTGLSYRSSSYGQLTAGSGTTTADLAQESYVFSAAGTIVLPTAVGISGKKYTILNTSAASLVLIDGNASETISGTVTKTLSSNRDSVTIQSDGSNWQIIGKGYSRVVSAKIKWTTGTPGITSQNPTWISSLSDNGTGDTTATLYTGIFSATPHCVCTPTGSGNGTPPRFCRVDEASATRFDLYAYTMSGGNLSIEDTTSDTHIICFGDR